MCVCVCVCMCVYVYVCVCSTRSCVQEGSAEKWLQRERVDFLIIYCSQEGSAEKWLQQVAGYYFAEALLEPVR